MKNLSRPLKALLLARTIASGVAADDHIPHVVGEHGHRHIRRRKCVQRTDKEVLLARVSQVFDYKKARDDPLV